MNIVVCVKQVPDTTVVKIDPKTGTLIRDGVPSIINPEDKHALEAALQLKEAHGGKVTVVSMGLPMAGVIKKLDYDIVFAGRQAIDGDTAQVGPEIAEHLNIPQVTYVQDVKVEGDSLIVNRALEDGHQIVEVKTPCLLTAIETLNEPRYMNVGNIFATNDNDIKVMSAEDIDVDKSELGLKGSPTKVKKSMTKEVKGAGELVKEGPKEAAAYVLGKLKEKHYI